MLLTLLLVGVAFENVANAQSAVLSLEGLPGDAFNCPDLAKAINSGQSTCTANFKGFSMTLGFACTNSQVAVTCKSISAPGASEQLKQIWQEACNQMASQLNGAHLQCTGGSPFDLTLSCDGAKLTASCGTGPTSPPGTTSKPNAANRVRDLSVFSGLFVLFALMMQRQL